MQLAALCRYWDAALRISRVTSSGVLRRPFIGPRYGLILRSLGASRSPLPQGED